MPKQTPQSNSAHYPSLAGKSIFVTGGASGIGEAIVRRLAGQNAKIAFLDIAKAAGEALADDLAAGGANVLFLHADLHDINALRAAIGAARQAYGPIQVLVNNAAHDERHDWRDVTPAYWDDRVGVNLKHVFFAIQAAAPDMIAAGDGSIVNFGSISWMLKQGGMPAYTASKAAIHGLTRSFARDLGKHGVRVNTVVPGWVMTQRQIDLWLSEESGRAMDAGMAIDRRIQPDDIAHMVAFLAADDSKGCSAQNFIVDGGWV